MLKRMRRPGGSGQGPAQGCHVRRWRRRTGVGIRGRMAGAAASIPFCQRMPRPRLFNEPSETSRNSGTYGCRHGLPRDWRLQIVPIGWLTAHHFTPAIHGPQSTPPGGHHQGWHDLPDAHGGVNTETVCQKPWLCWNTTDPGVEGHLYPDRCTVEDWATARIVGHLSAAGAGKYRWEYPPLSDWPRRRQVRAMSQGLTTPAGTDSGCKCSW